jgi:hypothetical protein
MIDSPINGKRILLGEKNISTIKTILNYISKQIIFSTEANVLTDETQTVPHWKQTSVLLEACYIGSKI